MIFNLKLLLIASISWQLFALDHQTLKRCPPVYIEPPVLQRLAEPSQVCFYKQRQSLELLQTEPSTSSLRIAASLRLKPSSAIGTPCGQGLKKIELGMWIDQKYAVSDELQDSFQGLPISFIAGEIGVSNINRQIDGI
jgi:hypothetical protein